MGEQVGAEPLVDRRLQAEPVEVGVLGQDQALGRVEVAVEHAEAAADALLHRGLVDLHAAAVHVLLLDELAEQLAVATRQVEHRRAVRHEVLDELVVDAAHHGLYVRAPLDRNAAMMPSIFSRSSRNASWP